MAAAGVVLDTSTGAALARSLAAVRAASPGSGALIGALATRAMSEAQYFSTGEHCWPPCLGRRTDAMSPGVLTRAATPQSHVQFVLACATCAHFEWHPCHSKEELSGSHDPENARVND